MANLKNQIGENLLTKITNKENYFICLFSRAGSKV